VIKEALYKVSCVYCIFDSDSIRKFKFIGGGSKHNINKCVCNVMLYRHSSKLVDYMTSVRV